MVDFGGNKRSFTESIDEKMASSRSGAMIASYARKMRKTTKPAEDKLFSFFLEKKPSVLLRELSSFLTDSVDLPSLLHETCDVLKNVTKASGVTLYMVDTTANEIYLARKGADRSKTRWKIEERTIIAAFVANKKEYVMSDDIFQDERFPEGIPRKGTFQSIVTSISGDAIKSVLCVPVVTPDGDCIAIIELYKQTNGGRFSKDDLKITIVVTGWMGAAIHQNQQRLALKKQQELNDYLLDLTRNYFSDTVVMEKMISDVVKFAKLTLGAERGSFFIIDKENDELVADLFDEGLDENDISLYKKNTKIRFGKERGIAGLVARTGVTVNIKDAYNDPRFNKEIDQKTGFITKSILCMPIMGVEGILGVVQVVNKKNGGYFTQTDENLFKTFSVYCALALHYTKVNQEMNKTLHVSNISLKLLRLQLKPCVHDLENFALNPETKIPPDFHQFSWYINLNSFAYMPQFCLYMILQVVHSSEINVKNMMQFILSTRKLYRNNPYHNFEHAFNTKALIISALCHDLDHGGFTNNFLQLISDDLSELYEESFLENHHYRVTMTILNDCEIYSNLSENTFKLISKEIKEAILATDLALYFKFRAKLAQICNDNLFDWGNATHRSLVKSIMMTSCDLSGQCKPFHVAKRITDNLYREFYHQGDMEKQMGLHPLSIMDRDKTHTIPEDQVQFLNIVVIPCVDILRVVLPNTEDLYNEAV
ncbi:cAMP and cAMP-inhibited cGMP 3',5'-cyclic phosphodiesterase 10A [Asbolus verrucosus]|uniref:Phosphodiesterase n=1 Tax=Asbolus verrucosus TaxID=1661398 RepID=A0A482VRN8_ASBVE|nr:cAMP and cAMP-inhibited cGMP 3',5'-cyclic phosphodiesterase 10A [Asbolus verrucosus]